MSEHGTLPQGPAILPLPTLDDEITKLQSSLASIKKQKIWLDSAIDDYRALLSPFRRLPDDILGEIFIWCLPEDQNAVMIARDSPLLLGRVCSRWRSLVYSYPRLWTTLHLSSPVLPPEYPWNSTNSWVPLETRQQLLTNFDRLFHIHCEAIQDWLNRSHNLSLSISIDLESNVRVPALLYHNLTKTYLNILLSSSTRWRSLELSIPTWLYNDFFTSLQPDSLPRLEFLQISFAQRSRTASHLHYWKNSGIFNSKKLRVLHLSRNPFRLSALGIDWPQITHLILFPYAENNASSSFTKVSLKEAFTLFKGCKRLQHCSLEINESPIEGPYPYDTILLPVLESLTLMDAALSLDNLLQYIQVPSLHDVTYYTRFSPVTPRRSPLLSLLRQSNNNVQFLTTSLDFFTVNDLVECFSLVPHLNHLKNAYSWPTKATPQQKQWRRAEKPFQKKMMKAILDLLLPNALNMSDGKCPCPDLHILTLQESFGLSDQDAVDFLQQRLAVSMSAPSKVKRLSDVSIRFDTQFMIDISAQLRLDIDEGMVIDITYPPSRNFTGRPGTFNPVNGLDIHNHLNPWF